MTDQINHDTDEGAPTEPLLPGTPETLAVPAAVEATTKPKKKGKLGILGWMCVAWLALMVVCAAGANLLPIESPADIDFSADVLATPGTENHPLGTDEVGRDILARLVFGARVSLVVGFGVALVGGTIGTAIGIVSGFLGGTVDLVLMGLVGILLAFPALILLIAVAAFLQPTLPTITLAISVIAVPAFARIARATTLTFAQREFVTAARALGAKRSRILVREILPNVLYPVVAFALLVVAIAIVAEGGLAFLSLSVQGQASWGGMINGGRGDLNTAPHVSLIPALVMFLTVLSVNFLGDKFRTAFDVKDAGL